MPREYKPTLYVTTTQAMDYLGFRDLRRLRRMVDRGELKGFKKKSDNKFGNRYMIDFDSVVEWKSK